MAFLAARVLSRLQVLQYLQAPRSPVFSGEYSWPCGQWVLARCLAPLAGPPSANPVVLTTFVGCMTSARVSPFRILSAMVSCLKPSALAVSAILTSTPSTICTMLQALLRDCSFRDAHLQFSGVYPKSLSTRSSVRPGGRAPMSDKNCAKLVFQAVQTVIPRPPYLWYAGLLGLSQRRNIACHVA